MIKSMRLNEVHNGNHKFHSMFILRNSSTKWLLVDDAVKFRVKFGIILSISRLILTIGFVIFVIILEAPSVALSFLLSRASLFPSWPYTHSTQTFPAVVSCKLSTLSGSLTISKDYVMPRMSINNRSVSIVSQVSTSAKQIFQILLLCF
jgi:hypothetical protein